MILDGAVFVSAANNLLAQSFVKHLHELPPDVSPQALLEAGATHFMQVVSATELPDVLRAYNNSISPMSILAAVVDRCGFRRSWYGLD